MKYTLPLALLTVLFATLACGLPGAQTPPTAAPLPPTPNFMPTLAPAPPPATQAPEAATPFTGTWNGPDPDDGSAMILTLVQTGNTLEGRYSDSYSPNVAPPGYDGTLTGSVLSPTTATMTLQLSRHDGQNLLLQADITLSDQNTIQVTITSQSGIGLWVLTRQ